MELQASLSAANSGTSGAQHAANTAGGGLKLPPYLLPLALVLIFVVAVVMVIRK